MSSKQLQDDNVRFGCEVDYCIIISVLTVFKSFSNSLACQKTTVFVDFKFPYSSAPCCLPTALLHAHTIKYALIFHSSTIHVKVTKSIIHCLYFCWIILMGLC